MDLSSIPFGVSAHAHEAAPAGTDLDGNALIPPEKFAPQLFASPGSADGVPHPARMEAASRGSAAIMELRFELSSSTAEPEPLAMYRIILPENPDQQAD